MRRIWLFFWLIGYLILLPKPSVFGCAPNNFEDRGILLESTPLYHEVILVATKWKDALLMKDIEALTSYALPEYRNYVKSHLMDRTSFLYHILYDRKWNEQRGSRSAYDILRTAKRLKIVMEQHKSLKELGGGISVYYYDENKIKPKFPLDYKEGQQLINRGDVLVMFFFKDEGKWYVSYEFHEQDK